MKKNKKQSCQISNELIAPKCNCHNNENESHVFMNGKYYHNGKYFGDVVYSDEKIIQIECKNGNRYMDGQIITMYLSLKKTLG